MTGEQKTSLPAPLRRVIDKAKELDDPRFRDYGARYGTTKYAKFEKEVARIQHEDVNRKNLILRPHYSPSSYACRPVPSIEPGSLLLAFTFYASLLSDSASRGSRETKSLTYDAIKVSNTTLSLGELTCFARDFRLVPYLISREGLRYAFQRHQISKKFLKGSTLGNVNALHFDGFVEVLVRCALLAYPELHNPTDRIVALADYLELSDTSTFRRRIQAIARLVQARLMGPRAKHHTADHAALDLRQATNEGDQEQAEFLSAFEKRRHSKYLAGMRRLVNRALDLDIDEATKVALQWLPSVRERKSNQQHSNVMRAGFERKGSLARSSDESRNVPSFSNSSSGEPQSDRGNAPVEDFTAQGSSKVRGRACTSQRRKSVKIDEAISYSDRERVHIRHRAKFAKADALFEPGLCKVLQAYQFDSGIVRWLPFGGQYLDMGVMVKGTKHKFKIEILNTSSSILSCEAVLDGLPSGCSVNFDSRLMPQGFVRNAYVNVTCNQVGEFMGNLTIRSYENSHHFKLSKRKLAYVEVCPIYLKVQDPECAKQFFHVKPKEMSLDKPTKTVLKRERSMLAVAPTKRLTKQKSRGVVFGMSLPSPKMLPRVATADGNLEPYWLKATKRPLPLQVSTSKDNIIQK